MLGTGEEWEVSVTRDTEEDPELDEVLGGVAVDAWLSTCAVPVMGGEQDNVVNAKGRI